jgi:hypothetical protein
MFAGNFQTDVTVLSPKTTWTVSEIKEAVTYVRHMNEYLKNRKRLRSLPAWSQNFDILCRI